MKNMAKVLMILALGAVICLPGMASADTVSLAFQGVSPNFTTNITAFGEYLSKVNTGNYTISYSTDPTAIINGYCVDPQETLLPTGTYATYTLVPIGSTYQTPSLAKAYTAAAWILSQEYSGTQTAEAQVAVWELAWDYANNKKYSLTSGNFKLNSPNPWNSQFALDVATIYNNALAAVADGFDASGFVLATNANYQDFLVPNPVPAPGTFILLGSGLAGLGVAFYRRRRASLRG